jgi:hypothetical protein
MLNREHQSPANTPPPLPAAARCGCAHAHHSDRFTPLLKPLLHRRWPSLTLGALGLTQIGLTMRHMPAWPCPFFHLTGIPCPGCGATRACVALLRGHWAESLRMHALGSAFLAVIVLLLIGGLLPERSRRAFVASIEWFERRTAPGYVFFVLLVFYWIARLTVDPHGFIRLMKV